MSKEDLRQERGWVKKMNEQDNRGGPWKKRCRVEKTSKTLNLCQDCSSYIS